MKRTCRTSRIIYTYKWLLTASKHFLELSNDMAGQTYKIMATCLFCAFTLESYLNHLGNLNFKCWADLERSLSPKAKLKIICEKLHFQVDNSKRPFQSFDLIFKLRNKLVHSRTEEIESTSENSPLTRWEKLCTLDNARNFVEDTEKVIDVIDKQAKMPPVPMEWTDKYEQLE